VFALYRCGDARLAARYKPPKKAHQAHRLESWGGEKVAMMNMKNWMLGTALVVGTLTLGAVAVQAAPEFRGHEFRGGEHFGGGDRGREFRGYEGRRDFRGPVVREGFVGGGYGVGYVPPCPGAGYEWIDGAWVFGGAPRVYGYGYGYAGRPFVGGYDRGRGFDRGDHGRGFAGRGGFRPQPERGFRR